MRARRIELEAEGWACCVELGCSMRLGQASPAMHHIHASRRLQERRLPRGVKPPTVAQPCNPDLSSWLRFSWLAKSAGARCGSASERSPLSRCRRLQCAAPAAVALPFHSLGVGLRHLAHAQRLCGHAVSASTTQRSGSQQRLLPIQGVTCSDGSPRTLPAPPLLVGNLVPQPFLPKGEVAARGSLACRRRCPTLTPNLKANYSFPQNMSGDGLDSNDEVDLNWSIDPEYFLYQGCVCIDVSGVCVAPHGSDHEYASGPFGPLCSFTRSDGRHTVVLRVIEHRAIAALSCMLLWVMACVPPACAHDQPRPPSVLRPPAPVLRPPCRATTSSGSSRRMAC